MSIDNKPVCVTCYEDNYADKCAGCSKPIQGKHLKALDEFWHEACWKCNKCEALLAGNRYFSLDTEDGKKVPICETCAPTVNNIPAPGSGGSGSGSTIPAAKTCDVCGELLTDEAIFALERFVHRKCFACFKCKKPIENATFLVKAINGHDEPFCSEDCVKD